MPQQCPKCGRFLSSDFVRGVQERLEAPAGVAGPGTGRRPGRPGQIVSCPRCNTMVTGKAVTTAGSGSVRPPDLPPESVRHEGDVLAGWDEVGPRGGRHRLDSEPTGRGHAALPRLRVLGPLRRLRGPKTAPLAAPPRNAAHIPTLAVVVCGSLAGCFLGARLAPQRRSLGAAVGTLAGAGAAVTGVKLLDMGEAEA